MPRLLKAGTINRLEGALNALRLALFGLAIPRCAELEMPTSARSAEIGLLGAAAELALSACIHEVKGESALVKTDGRFLVAREILDLFRRVLRSGAPRLTVLTRGADDEGRYLSDLANATGPFPVLFSARASGLHVGAGVSHDVAVAAASDVHRFLTLLARADRWQPYLREIPAVPPMPRERVLIAQDLARTLLEDKDGKDMKRQLQSIFLVLPELVEDTPEWLGALDRVQVTPRQNDLTILLRSLRGAKTGDLLKVGKGSKGIATRVENRNQNALPVRIERFKSTATSLEDRFQVDITEANTYLDQGRLRLPPIRSIYEYFAIGLEHLGLVDETERSGLTGHEAWPMVASALNYTGTPGPVFFIAQFTRNLEIGQMIALLSKAAKLNTHLKNRVDDYTQLLVAIARSERKFTGTVYEELTNALNERMTCRTKLEEKLKNRFKRMGVLQDFAEGFLNELDTSDDLGPLIETVLKKMVLEERDNLDKAAMPTLRDLINATTEQEEVFSLLHVLEDQACSAVYTEVRKAIRVLDFSMHCFLLQTNEK